MQPMEIRLEVQCEIDPDSLQAFRQLLSELLPLTNPEILNRIVIVSDSAVASTVNATLYAAHGISGGYSPGSNLSRAIAVPIETDEGLRGTIVIGGTIVEGLSPMRYHAVEAVSVVLEELLHLRLYSATWKLQNAFFHQMASQDECFSSLLVQIVRMRDEYVVGRWKVEIAGSIPLFDDVHGNRLVTGGFRYGDSIGTRLDRAVIGLVDISTNVASRTSDAPAAWNQLLDNLYRNVFEPLARDSAFRFGTPDTSLTEEEASANQLFRNFFATHWSVIRTQLERTVSSELEDAELALEVIVKEVREFLGEIGIAFLHAEDNQCRVDFSNLAIDQF